MTDDLPLASASTVIELIGNYAVSRELGGGATGRVYACKDLGLNRDVAIKILDEDLLADDVAVQRFEREGRILGRLDSPHTVRMFQVGVHGKQPFMVMELLDGRDAESMLREQGGKLPLSQALKIGRDVAIALAAAHAHGVVHRDVKPSNIIVDGNGAKLTDFGLASPIDGSARLTQAQEIPGTAAYLAPERVGGSTDPRCDIYSLGCTLYHLIAGRPPFEGSIPIEVIAAHLKDPPPPLVSRSDVVELVMTMLEKAPEHRPQSADEVARRLQAILSNEALPKQSAPSESNADAQGEAKAEPTPPELHQQVPETAEPSLPLASPSPAPSIAKRIAAARDRWRPRSMLHGKIAAAVMAALALLIVVVVARGGPEEDVRDALARIHDGEAREVLADFDDLDKDDVRPADELIRGHALMAIKDEERALGAYRAAARAGFVDHEALENVIDTLDRHPADNSIDVLVAWPKKDVKRRLEGVVADGAWWARHNALIVLEKRGEAGDVNVTALGIKDLEEGATCKQRKHGLNLLKERGRGEEALEAIDQAQRRTSNGCMWFTDYDTARRSIRSRARTDRQ